MTRTRRTYTREFKLEAVPCCRRATGARLSSNASWASVQAPSPGGSRSPQRRVITPSPATAAIGLRVYERLPGATAVHEATQATREFSRYRDQLVKERTASLNRLHTYLANQYSAYKVFFSQVNGVTALNLWATCPTSVHLGGTTPSELANLLYEKNIHRLGKAASHEKAQHILEHVDGSDISELDLLTKAQGQIIRDLAQRLLQLKRSTETVEAGLEDTLPATGQQLETFNGMGTVVVPHPHFPKREGS